MDEITVRANEAARMLGISRSEFDRSVRRRLNPIRLRPGCHPLYLVAEIRALVGRLFGGDPVPMRPARVSSQTGLRTLADLRAEMGGAGG